MNFECFAWVMLGSFFWIHGFKYYLWTCLHSILQTYIPVLSGLRWVLGCKLCGCGSTMLYCGLYELLPLKSDLALGWVVMWLLVKLPCGWLMWNMGKWVYICYILCLICFSFDANNGIFLVTCIYLDLRSWLQAWRHENVRMWKFQIVSGMSMAL